MEIEDRGIGISADELARINDRLANPPEFDLADSDRLGLFVVARLAAKHRIKIVMRPSPYGGTTAIVLLPRAIVVTRDAPEAGQSAELPARPVAAFAATAARPGAGTSGLTGPPGPDTEEVRTWPGGPGAAGPAAEAPASGPSASESESGLPHRVRQANLAPQLKNGAGPLAGEAPPAVSRRTPEESRSFFEDLQHGWMLARSEPDPLDGPEPADWPQQAAVAEDREGM
jgi:hypothetical protein